MEAQPFLVKVAKFQTYDRRNVIKSERDLIISSQLLDDGPVFCRLIKGSSNLDASSRFLLVHP